MSHTTLNEETHGDQTEKQNESKLIDSEILDNKSDVVGICEIDKQQNAKEYESEIYRVIINLDKDVAKQTNDNIYYISNKEDDKLTEYWVQFNFTGGSRIPDSGGAPLYYEPDRNFFVRIVFSIVLFMLILTAGFVVFVYMTDVKRIILRYGLIVLIVGMVGMLGLNYAMMCCPYTRRPPCNFICLFLAVCFMSLIAAYITARYRTQVVLLALLATIVTVVVCLCLACTRFDFTKYLLYVIVISAAFAAIALIISITMLVMKTRYRPLTLVILVVGTLLNVIILTIELQMILGGRTVELSEDDYALGAFMLYTSIVDIFLKLVQILGICDSD